MKDTSRFKDMKDMSGHEQVQAGTKGKSGCKQPDGWKPDTPIGNMNSIDFTLKWVYSLLKMIYLHFVYVWCRKVFLYNRNCETESDRLSMFG